MTYTTPFPLLEAPAPADPAIEGMCRLYGRLVSPSGQPLPFETVEVRFAWTDSETPAISGNLGMVREPVFGFTGRDGVFFVDVPQSSEIAVRFPGSRKYKQMSVPALAKAPLFPYLFPYPVKLYWTVSTADGGDEGVVPVPEAPPGFVDVAVGDYYVGLAALYSDGFACRLSEPNFAVTGEDEFELVSPNTIRVRRTTPGTAIITSLEEEILTGDSLLWTRAGYQNPLPPYFIPTTSYYLQDAPPLSVVFA